MVSNFAKLYYYHHITWRLGPIAIPHDGWRYRIPNGPPNPSPALALNGSALCHLTLCGPMDSSWRAVPGVVPDWRPRPGPMADFLGRAGTTPRTARWVATRPGTNLELLCNGEAPGTAAGPAETTQAGVAGGKAPPQTTRRGSRRWSSSPPSPLGTAPRGRPVLPDALVQGARGLQPRGGGSGGRGGSGIRAQGAASQWRLAGSAGWGTRRDEGLRGVGRKKGARLGLGVDGSDRSGEKLGFHVYICEMRC
jgi:hypothetical protein